MDFTLKKILSAILLPFPIATIFIALSILILIIFNNKKLSLIASIIGLSILLAFSCSYIPTLLLANLENQYQPITKLPKTTNTIVVLGGGVRNNTLAPPNTQLSSASLSRLMEGIRIYQLYKNHNQQAVLVLSGGKAFGKPAEAGVLQNTAVALGVSQSNLKIENGSRDTLEEAQHLTKQLGDKPFILVTSAYHMPRAMLILKKQGLKPIPAPTQFIAGSDRRLPKFYLPNAKYLATADIAIHEYLGILWFKVSH